MRFVYFVTRGASDPTKASIPLHLAVNGSVAVGHDTAVVMAGDSTEIVLGDHAERMEGVGVPPMHDLVAKLREHAVPVYVRKACAVVRGATEQDLAKVGGTWVTPPDVAKLCAETDRVLTF